MQLKFGHANGYCHAFLLFSLWLLNLFYELIKLVKLVNLFAHTPAPEPSDLVHDIGIKVVMCILEIVLFRLGGLDGFCVGFKFVIPNGVKRLVKPVLLPDAANHISYHGFYTDRFLTKVF
jgi:hypothetical protein